MKTIEQEKLEGNPGRRPVNENAPMASGAVPNPPKHLNRVATYKYHQLARMLGPDGARVAGATDGEAIAQAAFAYSKFRAAQKVLDEKPKLEYYTTPTGQIKKHPATSEVSDWWGKYQASLSRLGLSPYDRKNVDALPEEKKETRKEKLAKLRAEAEEKAAKIREQAEKGEHVKAV